MAALTAPLRTHPPAEVARQTEVALTNGFAALELPATIMAMATALARGAKLIVEVSVRTVRAPEFEMVFTSPGSRSLLEVGRSLSIVQQQSPTMSWESYSFSLFTQSVAHVIGARGFFCSVDRLSKQNQVHTFIGSQKCQTWRSAAPSYCICFPWCIT